MGPGIFPIIFIRIKYKNNNNSDNISKGINTKNNEIISGGVISAIITAAVK